MKRAVSFLVFCLCFAVGGSLLAITVSAQQDSSSRKKNQKNSDGDSQQMNNPDSTNSVNRTPEELAFFQQVLDLAVKDGTTRVTVKVRDFEAQDELLRQLAPFKAELVTKYVLYTYVTLDVDAAAIIYMRDSPLVLNIRPVLIGGIATGLPVRTPEELAFFQEVIELAIKDGTTRVIVGVRDFEAQDELLRQLAPFKVELVTKYVVVPYVTLDVDAAAIIYMRDSPLVLNVRANRIGRPATGLPVRTPEELAYFQKAIETALRNGTVRVIVGLNVSFTPEGNLTPEQRQTQRAAISLAQDELLRQLIPYQTNLVTRFDIVPYLTLDVDATALIFMRDSRIVLNVRENGIGYPTRKNRKKRFSQSLQRVGLGSR